MENRTASEATTSGQSWRALETALNSDWSNHYRYISRGLEDHAYFGFDKLAPVQRELLFRLPGLVEPVPYPSSGELDLKKKGDPLAVEPAKTDILIKAGAGAGKTLAYLIAAYIARQRYLHAMQTAFMRRVPEAHARELIIDRVDKVMGAVIFCRERDHAYTIARTAEELFSKTDLHVQLWVTNGDQNRAREDLINKRPDIFVASPSRWINGPMPRLYALSKRCPLVIWDGLEKMTDPGNRKMIDAIHSQKLLHPDHQTIVLLEKDTEEVQPLMTRLLRPGYVTIDTLEQDETTMQRSIPQYMTVLASVDDFWLHLFRLLAHDACLHPAGGKAVVFLPTQGMVEIAGQMCEHIMRALPWAEHMHILSVDGRREFRSRDAVYSMFTRAQGGYAVLFATDLQWRGIEHHDVTRIIQVGVPNSQKDYDERVNAVGRVGVDGRSDIILFPWEIDFLHNEPFGGHSVEPVTVKELEEQVIDAAKAGEAAATGLPINPAVPFEKLLDQRSINMPRDVGLRLARLEGEIRAAITKISATNLQQDKLGRLTSTFIGFYRGKTGRLRRRHETIVKHVMDFATAVLGAKGDLTLKLHERDRLALGLEPLTEEQVSTMKAEKVALLYEAGLTWEQKKAATKQRKLDMHAERQVRRGNLKQKREAGLEFPARRFGDFATKDDVSGTRRANRSLAHNTSRPKESRGTMPYATFGRRERSPAPM